MCKFLHCLKGQRSTTPFTGILQLKMLNDLLLKYFAHDNHHHQMVEQLPLNF